MTTTTGRPVFIIRLNRVDLLTLSGVVTSALAVAALLEQQFHLATALLFLAMLGDALDGLLARRLGLARNFGRYLDGFMDVLIYLVAPALAWYLMGFDGFWGVFLIAMIAAGCVRLAVFNEVGNLQEDSGLAYLGMPVFWSVFLLAAHQLLAFALLESLNFALLAAALAAFAFAMLWHRPFFKFKKLAHILALTLGGALLFFVLHLAGGTHG
ncbi:MAG: CDP-diacylglycerol--serine O-phosphatidyltransferase [Moraxellaceae bacterium]|jgi:CDP-diacylglycerol--serine O-phosphatidyltransferase|nr:CDP-diacylglycerol--serine O-phosphatidyltransferase [Moraxellaceae bacterium]